MQFSGRSGHRGEMRREKSVSGPGKKKELPSEVQAAKQALSAPNVTKLQVKKPRGRLGAPAEILRFEGERVWFREPNSRHPDERHVLDVVPVLPAGMQA